MFLATVHHPQLQHMDLEGLHILPKINTEVTFVVSLNAISVDNGLISMSSTEEIVSLMERTKQALLEEGGLRLHKFVSNSSDVMSHFPTEDLAKDLMSLDLIKDNLPIQRSLGLSWNLRTDSFTFRLSLDEKPYTRRGVLSCLNSFYDPIGFVAPVLVRGKQLLRQLIEESTDCDQHLPEQYQVEWDQWKQQLPFLENLEIPRPYLPVSPEKGFQERNPRVYRCV